MGSGQRWGPGGQWRRRGEEQEEAVLEESLWRTGRPELLPSLRYLHAHQHLLRGEAELPCPGMCPAQREGRRSGQCGRDDWAWGRDSCAPVPTIVLRSAWQLVPMVGVESMLPALQEPDEDLVQGLCLSCTSTGWGPLLPLLQGGRAGWHPASEGDLPQPHPVPR